MANRICSVPDCGRPFRARGYCVQHYRKAISSGELQVKPPVPWETLFWAKVQRGSDQECWPWMASLNGCGYGKFNRAGHFLKAHRLAWEQIKGPIPEGLVLDHLCRNRACCNPAHLEPVTLAENTRRGQSPHVVLHEQGRCARGHDMNEHGYPISGGTGKPKRRGCALCREINLPIKAAKERERHARRRLEANAR